MQMPSDRIRMMRRGWKLSQQAFGALAGVSKAAVSLWEKGETTPGWDALHALQAARGLNPRWVLHGEEPTIARRSPGGREGTAEDRPDDPYAAGFAAVAASRPRDRLSHIMVGMTEEDLDLLADLAERLARRQAK